MLSEEEKKARKAAREKARYAANREKLRAQAKARYAANREKIRAQVNARVNAWRAANREKYLAQQRARRAANREKYLAQQRAYYEANQEKFKARKRAWYSERYENNIQFRLSCLLRNRLKDAVRNAKIKKIFHRAIPYLGCTIPELKVHIEKQFEPWMTWENQGQARIDGDFWQIDHIIPLASGDLRDPVFLAAVCHYTNLRPVHWQVNLSKGKKAA